MLLEMEMEMEMELEVALDPVKAAPSSASTASKDLSVAKTNLPI